MNYRIALAGLVLLTFGIGWYFATRDPEVVELPPIIDYLPVDETPIEGEDAESEAAPLLQGREEPTPVAPPSTTKGEGEGDIRFTGSVVDVDDKPVKGAIVSAKFRGEVIRTVTTDDGGAYRFRASFDVDDTKFRTGIVFARGSTGDVGYGFFVVTLSPNPGSEPLGAERKILRIMLRPGASLEVQVSSMCSGGLPATVWVASPLPFSTNEALIRDETDASGRLTLEGLPPGQWRVIAATAGCGRDTTVAQIPQPEPKTIELSLPDARKLTIHVKEKGNGKPIVGARIDVFESVRMPSTRTHGALVSAPSAYETDERGVAIIEGLGTEERLTLKAQADGFPVGGGRFGRGAQGIVDVPSDAQEVSIELARPRTVRWPIEDKGQGIPPDGTAIELRPFTNSGLLDIPKSGTVENGEIVVPGWSPGFAAAIAYAEGFGAARLGAGADEDVGYPATFHPLRKIELFVKHADGSPAEGIFLITKDGGNNEIVPAVKTDAEGHAVMDELHGGPSARANCYASRTAQSRGGYSLGSVHLFKQDGRFEFTLPSVRKMRVTLTVDGQPVPEGFTSSVRLFGAFVTLTTDAQGICEVDITPSKSSGTFGFSVQSPDYVQDGPATGSLDGPDPIEVAVKLVQTGSALIQVLMPEDGRHHVVTQVWNNETKEWLGDISGMMSSGRERADPNGYLTMSQLRAGRYRAVDSRSKVMSEPFDVTPGGDPVRVTLDLRKVGWAKGRVVAPPGVPFSEFTVGVVGEVRGGMQRFGSSGGLPGRGIDRKDGTFMVRVPGDQPITLRMYHITCRPHPTKGLVEVTGPREGIELHAVYGPKATLSLADPLRMYMNPGRSRTLQVRLFKGDVQGKGIPLTGTLSSSHDTIEFGGFEPGTYTVWIDTLSAAPLLLYNIVLGDEDVDLGTHRVSDGSTFRIRVHVKEGQSPPRMHLSASRMGEPTYVRNTDSASETILLKGLGKGRFQIHGGFYAGTGPGIHEEIVFDGKGVVERVIDLR